MTIQDQISALCAEAKPLRARLDGGGDELRQLVEQINELRALEASGMPVNLPAPVEGEEARPALDVAAVVEAVKRRGRPPKVTNA